MIQYPTGLGKGREANGGKRISRFRPVLPEFHSLLSIGTLDWIKVLNSIENLDFQRDKN